MATSIEAAEDIKTVDKAKYLKQIDMVLAKLPEEMAKVEAPKITRWDKIIITLTGGEDLKIPQTRWEKLLAKINPFASRRKVRQKNISP